jgi:hypothetical protein
MKTYKIKNRTGHIHTLILTDKNTLKFYPSKSINYMSASADEKGLQFIDPEGGPFISTGYTPAQLLHADLPQRNIVEIKQESDHYTFLLHDEKLVKNRTIKKNKKRK